MNGKSVITVGLMILLVISCHMERAVVEGSAADCYDACTTGCVQFNTRLMQRCDRKCQIKCEPASQVQENPGLV